MSEMASELEYNDKNNNNYTSETFKEKNYQGIKVNNIIMFIARLCMPMCVFGAALKIFDIKNYSL